MTHWYTLKLEKTKDKNEVRAAYMALLPNFNPEDDPEGFANLRNAYEEAIKEIDNEATDAEKSNDPVSIFFVEMKKLYKDFAKRIDPARWEEILKSDVCTALDTEEEVDVKMLEFIAENHNFPTKVWVVLDSRFGWTKRADELRKRYGPGLIDSIIGSVESKFDPHYQLFEYDPGADVDRFLFLRDSLTQALDNRNKDDAASLLEEIKGVGVRHPIYDIEAARYEALNENSAKALEILNAVTEKHPVFKTEPFFLYVIGTVLLSFEEKEKHAEALSTYKKALEIVPDYFFAQLGVVDTLVKQEEYDDAEKYISDVMLLENPSNEYLYRYFLHISGLKLKKYEELYAQDPTTDITEKLAQCYLRNNIHDKCIELLEDKLETGKAYSMLGFSYSRLKEYEKAIKYTEKSLELEPKFSAYITLSEIYLAQRLYKNVIENAEKGLTAGLSEEGTEIVGKVRLLADKAYAYKKLDEYDKALELINEAIAINDKMCNLYADKADILQDMYEFSDAYAEAEKAMNLMPNWPRPYELILDIFYRAGNYEQMLDVFAETDQMEMKSHGLTYFKGCRAGALEEYEECFKLLTGLLEEENLDTWEDKTLDALCFYYRSAENHEKVAEYSQKLIEFLAKNNFKPNAKAYMYLASAHEELYGPDKELETLIQGLKAMPESEDLLLQYDFHYDNEEAPERFDSWKKLMEVAPNNAVPYNRMAILYASEDRFQEALEVIARGLTKLPGNMNLIGRRAYVYQDMAEYQKAIDDYLLVAENADTVDTWWTKGYMYFEAGWLYWSKLNNAETAIKYFFLANENDGLTDNWEKSFMADAYEWLKDYDKALAAHSDCIDNDPDDEWAYLSRGILYKQLGESEKATADFETVLSLVSDNEDASHDSYRFAGTAYLELGDATKARKYYEKSAEVVKTDGTKNGTCFCVFQSWAKYYKHIGDYAKALEQIDIAIGLANSVRNNELKREIEKSMKA